MLRFRDRADGYDAKLGGIDIANGAVVGDIKYDIPEKPDIGMGKMPGSIEKQMEADIEKKKKEVVY